MEKKLFDEVSAGTMRCSKCQLIIPFVFDKKGPDYTCPSFTIVDEMPVCYHCYHPAEFKDPGKKPRK